MSDILERLEAYRQDWRDRAAEVETVDAAIDEIRRLRTALAAAEAERAGATPAGWRLVPVVATPDMCIAGGIAWADALPDSATYVDCSAACYAAMLAAAPEAPVPAPARWTPLRLAAVFHNTYEENAPRFGYETRFETRKFDPTSNNGRLMVEVCRRILAMLAAAPSRRPREATMPEITLDELRRIELALREYGACHYPDCDEPNCTHALVLVREKMREAESGLPLDDPDHRP